MTRHLINHKLKLGIVLFILGLVGIFSILTMEIPLPPEVVAILNEQFSQEQIKLLMLINPTIMLIVAVIGGVLLHDKVKLGVPLIEKLLGIKNNLSNPTEILVYGVAAGLLSGILLSLIGFVFTPVLPLEFMELGETLKPTLAARFLYGGLTEEILMRFGLMTFIVWLCSKIFGPTKPIIYWVGIFLAAIIFAFGHFPIAYQAVGNPSSSLLTYILIGNAVGGIIFGWVYWKKGLESAFIAHIFTNIILVGAEPILK